MPEKLKAILVFLLILAGFGLVIALITLGVQWAWNFLFPEHRFDFLHAFVLLLLVQVLTNQALTVKGSGNR